MIMYNCVILCYTAVCNCIATYISTLFVTVFIVILLFFMLPLFYMGSLPEIKTDWLDWLGSDYEFVWRK